MAAYFKEGEKSTADSWLQSTRLMTETEHEAWLLTPKACLNHHNTLQISLLLWKTSSFFWIAPFPQFLGVGSRRGPSWHKTSTLHLSGSSSSKGTESARITSVTIYVSMVHLQDYETVIGTLLGTKLQILLKLLQCSHDCLLFVPWAILGHPLHRVVMSP